MLSFYNLKFELPCTCNLALKQLTLRYKIKPYYMLSNDDLKYISDKGISTETINEQLQCFKRGFPYTKLDKAATINDGIKALDEEDITKYNKLYETNLEEGLEIAKFVPASGAATRMFKDLFKFIHSTAEEQEHLLTKEPYLTFAHRIDDFAFIDDLVKYLGDLDYKQLNTNTLYQLINALLQHDGLNYGALPKGLLKFHKEESHSVTPMEEHLKETAYYAGNKQSRGTVHFTVSPEHHSLFKKLLGKIKGELEDKYLIRYDVSFSYQKASTDTIAVKPDNTPFRNSDNTLLFRPAGHGALIENLNDMPQKLVFIKNIDNVVPEYRQHDTVKYKRALAGFLLEKKDTVFSILKELDKANSNTIDTALNKGIEFLVNELQMNASALETLSSDEKVALIREKLNRPVRVCGMVKNEGEPGGGPFWVKHKDGTSSLQIVEGAQIDPCNVKQQEILNSSTHFNPVDLVCYLNNYEGGKFDLTTFTDPETGFISEKTQNGNPLKALELPGLWNGAMANWLTFFVEVPVSTFNPVKTVMDLLREQHQPQSL